MKKLSISSSLDEKIYDLKINGNGISKITTYFPLNSTEKQEISEIVKNTYNSVHFKSIFSDEISESEWKNTKEQIKKKFQDELMKID
jgi:hypothetical protein